MVFQLALWSLVINFGNVGDVEDVKVEERFCARYISLLFSLCISMN